jgi:hypothetical protein
VTAFLVDQQLPKALATFLAERGNDARHIKEYEGGTKGRTGFGLAEWTSLLAASVRDGR